MKRMIFYAAFASIALSASSQTLEEILPKFEDAMGGREKLESIKSLHFTGISTGQNGNEITTDIWKVNNKLYRRTINFGMGTVTTLITDQGGWQTNFRNGGVYEPLPEQQRNNQLYEMDCAGPLVNYSAKGNKAELLGKEAVNGKDAFKIKVTTKEGRELTYYVDATSYQVSRLSFKGRARGSGGGGAGNNGNNGAAQEVEINVDYTNYDKTSDGYIFAFSQTITGGFAGTMTFEKIEVNPNIDEKLFKPE